MWVLKPTGPECRWAPEISKSSKSTKMTKNDVFVKSDCFWLFALFDISTKSWNRGGILEELNVFFCVFDKNSVFWSFLQKSTNSTKTCFLTFWAIFAKSHFFDDFWGPRRSGRFSVIFVFSGVGNPDLGPRSLDPGVWNHRSGRSKDPEKWRNRRKSDILSC